MQCFALNNLLSHDCRIQRHTFQNGLGPEKSPFFGFLWVLHFSLTDFLMGVKGVHRSICRHPTLGMKEDAQTGRCGPRLALPRFSCLNHWGTHAPPVVRNYGSEASAVVRYWGYAHVHWCSEDPPYLTIHSMKGSELSDHSQA